MVTYVDAPLMIQPLPWSVRKDSELLASVLDANGVGVLSGITMDESEFIVRAVNNHHELVEALGNARGWIASMEMNTDAGAESQCDEVAAIDGVLTKVERR